MSLIVTRVLRLLAILSLLECCETALHVTAQKYIENLIVRFEQNHGAGFHDVVNPPIPAIGKAVKDVEEFLLPRVILWNPRVTFPQLVSDDVNMCQVCENSLEYTSWNDGSTKNKQLRTLHDMADVVVLVSAVYICRNGHKLVAHDEIVLNCIEPKAVIPFCLLHKTGFTATFMDTLLAFFRRGHTFYSMESMILERRWETHVKKLEMVDIHNKLCGGNSLSIPKFEDMTISDTPSNTILTKCFLAHFFECENLYLKCAHSLQVGNSISFDHTFKVATNIGYQRTDGVWVCLYDSLFLVMDNTGHILTWQLTKGTAFSQVAILLQNLCKRAEEQKANLTTVYSDDCCKLRRQIVAVFGDCMSIKLDLFHATQRVTRTIPKRHPFASKVFHELRTVFRADGDTGEKRKLPTPSPEVLLSNIDKFADNWEHVKDDANNTVFTAQTMTAIGNLKRHIRYGCLSDIPPGGGTNRNERFHQELRKFAHRSRIGVQLAYALITVLIYIHNNQSRVSGKSIVKPIIAAAREVKNITCTLTPMGIFPKQKQSGSISDSYDFGHDPECRIIQTEHTLTLYSAMFEKFQIYQALKHMELTHDVSSYKQYSLDAYTDLPSHTLTSLQRMLLNDGLKLVPIAPDGNCFFSSVAATIVNDRLVWTECFDRLQIPQNSDVKVIATLLRNKFVEELKVNVDQYKPFFDERSFSYELEADKFTQNRYYNNALGDCMPLALANVLQASFVIYSCVSQQPLYVVPQTISIKSAVFLVHQPGHYDAAMPCVKKPSSESAATQNPVHCSCGVNRKAADKSPACSVISLYKSRCKCLENKTPCSSVCRCKNCNNLYGKRQPTAALPRKRTAHKLQGEIPPSKKFAQSRQEHIIAGPWSALETVAIKEIFKHFTDLDEVCTIYNSMVQYTKTPLCHNTPPQNAVFEQKTASQIAAKLGYHARAHTL